MRPAIVIGIAVVLALALVGLAIVVNDNRLSDVDRQWSTAIQLASAGRPLLVAHFLSRIGRAAIWDVGVGIGVGALILARRRTDGLLLLGGVVATELLTTGCKYFVGGLAAMGLSIFDILESAGFPSGHAARVSVAAGLFVVLVAGRTRWRGLSIALAILLALAIGWARIAVKSHVPSDVLGAYLVAGLIIDLTLLLRQLLLVGDHVGEPKYPTTTLGESGKQQTG